MNIDGLIKNHEEGIEILEAIKTLKMRRQAHIDNINSFAGTFPELRKKYLHKANITGRAIDRLWHRYRERTWSAHKNVVL